MTTEIVVKNIYPDIACYGVFDCETEASVLATGFLTVKQKRVCLPELTWIYKAIR